ncbi:hypothetical protein ACIOC2_08760 [Streptomyces sp. NPDC088337]|nr:hypothetical protein [Streptomyces sp. NBC_01788]WSB24600.1 hypothetical protein OIE49_00960 [Streptomyces sp. NBC_01788]
MNGRTGTKVSVRHLPHHDDTIEVFDAATGHHLQRSWPPPRARNRSAPSRPHGPRPPGDSRPI